MKTQNIFLLACVLILGTSCGNKEQTLPQQQGAMPLPVTELQLKTITGVKEYPTIIEGIINSEVRAKTSGYIQNVLVDEGQKVRKGQALFQLETQALNQDASAAKARVNVAQVEVDKLIPLVEKSIISPIQLETAKANLAQAKASFNSITANINYATIKSPVDGFVGAINFREGTLVSPNDATPLTTVTDISQVYAFFSLNETQYLDFLQQTNGKTLDEKIANYPKVNLLLANGSLYSEKGKIQTSTGQINPKTGTVSLRAIFNNPNHLITNGNSGKIQIPVVYENAVVIPQSATYEQQGKIMLFKLSKDNKAESTIVEVKASVDNLYIIESGLSANDKIITSGIGKIRDEMLIEPQNQPFSEAIEPIATLFKN